MTKVLLLGLDCADPRLVFDRWRQELPNLRRLMEAGVWGPLQSTIPPITVPAWACMMTGRDPGELGIYGFRNRTSYQYGALGITSSLSVQEETLWDILGRTGREVVVVGVPPSYPVKPVRGCLISCFLTPNSEVPFTHPPELKEEIQRLVGGYQFDVEGFRTDDKPRLLQQIHEMTEKRFRVLKHLLTRKPWDFFMSMEIGVDRMHHGFWKFHDEDHIKHPPGNPYQHVIRDYYRYVDKEIGELIEGIDEDTVIIVLSDHGVKRMEGGLCVNEWLMKEKYLSLSAYPKKLTSLSKLEVNWDRTMVWGEGGYYGRIYLNVKGREPQGVIAPNDVEKIRAELKQGMEELSDESGRPLGTRVFYPEEVYQEVRGIPPDLIVYFGDLDWRSVGTVGHRFIHTRENDTGPDDANHDTHGIFIMAKKADLKGGRTGLGTRLDGLSLYDVTPTILDLFGLPASPLMRGRVISPRA